MSQTARSRAWGGIVMILFTLAGWTSIPLFLNYFAHSADGSPIIDGWTANGWRYGFSALLWLPPLLWHWKRKSLPPGLWRAALMPSVFNALAQVAFGLAPYYVTPSLMTFSMRLQIVFLMFGAAVMFDSEKRVIRTRMFLVGIVLLMGGTLLTIWGKPGGLGGGSGLGIGLSIAAGLLYACYSLSVRKFMHGIQAFTAFAAVSQYTGIALVAAMLLFGDRAGAGAFSLNSLQWFMLLASAVIGIGIGHTLYYASMQRLGLAVASGVVQLQPVTVSIGQVLIFPNAEPLTTLQWVTGIAAIIGAVLMLAAQQFVTRQIAAGIEPKPPPPPAPPTRDRLPAVPDQLEVGAVQD